MDTQPLRQETIDAILKTGQSVRRRKSGGEFLRGPIPMAWLAKAARLRGRALAVGLGVWFKAGLTKQREVQLSGSVLRRLGLHRRVGYRGLAALEGAGLVSVDRHSGRCPVVTILDPQG